MANNCEQCFNTHYQPHCHPTTKSLWLCSSVYCGPPHPSRRIMVGSRQPKSTWWTCWLASRAQRARAPGPRSQTAYIGLSHVRASTANLDSIGNSMNSNPPIATHNHRGYIQCGRTTSGSSWRSLLHKGGQRITPVFRKQAEEPPPRILAVPKTATSYYR